VAYGSNLSPTAFVIAVCFLALIGAGDMGAVFKERMVDLKRKVRLRDQGWREERSFSFCQLLR
jgi:hypothetical protein